MRVLVIGGDPDLFRDDSEALSRIRDYAGLFDAFSIVSMTGRGYSPKLYGNLSIAPTNSATPFLRVYDALRIASRLVREKKPDVIDAQDAGESGLAAWLLSKRFRIPFRVQIHTDILSPWYRRASWKERVRYYIANFLIPRVDCIRVVSERVKKSLTSQFHIQDARVSVLPVFTDTRKFFDAASNPATDERLRRYEFKLISVGRFVDKEKNFSMLIEVMRDFVNVVPDSVLVLVGDGPDRKRYEQKIKNSHLEKNVILERRHADLPSFYKSFDLFLLSSNYEGWGRTVIEAMASGLPVLMTDVGLAGEVVQSGSNGMVVPPHDKIKFLEAVKELYKNRDRRMKFAMRGKETVMRLAPKTRGEYLGLYKSVFGVCIRP